MKKKNVKKKTVKKSWVYNPQCIPLDLYAVKEKLRSEKITLKPIQLKQLLGYLDYLLDQELDSLLDDINNEASEILDQAVYDLKYELTLDPDDDHLEILI